MHELCAELDACLAELDPSSEEATMISRSAVAPPPPPPPAHDSDADGRILWPIAAVAGVIGVAGLAALGVVALRDDDGNGSAAARPTRRSASAASIHTTPRATMGRSMTTAFRCNGRRLRDVLDDRVLSGRVHEVGRRPRPRREAEVEPTSPHGDDRHPGLHSRDPGQRCSPTGGFEPVSGLHRPGRHDLCARRLRRALLPRVDHGAGRRGPRERGARS